jgi:hypothetical protein
LDLLKTDYPNDSLEEKFQITNTVVGKGGRWTKLAPGEIEQKQ